MSSEVTDNNKRDFQVGEVVVWKFNGEKGVVVKHIPLLDAVRIVFDSEASVLCWCSEISRLETI